VRVELPGGGARTSNFDIPSFDLTGIFSELAREDFNRAADLAKALGGESPRSVATLAATRAILIKRAQRSSDDEEETR
jgi:hypothetical protein